MTFIKITSPHSHYGYSTAQLMSWVLLATVPGLLVQTWFFGWGSFINLCWAGVLALLFEAGTLILRKRPVLAYLKDYSALVTAFLLALALPSFVPWWITLISIGTAIVIAKHLYGGIGNNPFNPAMVGYALVLVSFPLEMTQWATSIDHLNGQRPDFLATLKIIFIPDSFALDAYTMATPLDSFKHKDSLTATEAFAQIPVLQNIRPWQIVNLAYLLGGIFLLYKKVFTWHAPVSMLLALFLLSGLFYAGDPSLYGSPGFHLSMGATMMAAFFIITDPVSSATSQKGRIYYGIGIGILLYIIRTWGHYPDAVAFAVLIMNLAAPLIDTYTKPRAYGHQHS